MTVVIKWLGHAGFQIRTEGKIIYVDPYELGVSDKADLVLLTHSHYDHCNQKDIQRIRKTGTAFVAPSDCASRIGGNVKSLRAGEEFKFGSVTVKAVHAYNVERFKSPGQPFHPRDFGVGYLILAEGKTIYHSGDTDLIPEMRKLGSVDVALVPSGGTYTMDNPEAAEAALAINPKTVIPMHRWDTDPKEFRKAVTKSNPKISVVLLSKDQEFQVV